MNNGKNNNQNHHSTSNYNYTYMGNTKNEEKMKRNYTQYHKIEDMRQKQPKRESSYKRREAIIEGSYADPFDYY